MLKLNTGEFLRIKKNNSLNHDDGEIVLSWYVHIYLFYFLSQNGHVVYPSFGESRD